MPAAESDAAPLAVTVVPEFQTSLPVRPSNAHREPVPRAYENTTPLMTIGVVGDPRSREVQPGASAGAPSFSTSFHAITAPGDDARIQRVPAGSCQDDRVSAAKPMDCGA